MPMERYADQWPSLQRCPELGFKSHFMSRGGLHRNEKINESRGLPGKYGQIISLPECKMTFI